MATLEKVRDEDYSISADGSSVTRIKYVEGESLKDIVDSGLLPGYRSVHPVFRQMRLESGNFEQTGNTDGKIQGIWTGNYSTPSNSGGGSSGASDDTDPWELDAQEFRKSPFPVERPLKYGYNAKGERIQLLNSAGCQLELTGEIHGTQYTFVFYTKKEPKVPSEPVINSSSITIAGENFPQYSALLYPPEVNHIVDRDDKGEILRSYYEIPVTIRTLPGGWMEKPLDIGTLARFGDDPTPQPIYKYHPWTSKDESENMKVRPAFGSIQDVLAAKRKYAEVMSGGSDTSSDAYKSAYKELPYDEMTEPLPLTPDGKVYVEAMTDPAKHPYNTIDHFKFQLVNFSQYNLPKKREGK